MADNMADDMADGATNIIDEPSDGATSSRPQRACARYRRSNSCSSVDLMSFSQLTADHPAIQEDHAGSIDNGNELVKLLSSRLQLTLKSPSPSPTTTSAEQLSATPSGRTTPEVELVEYQETATRWGLSLTPSDITPSEVESEEHRETSARD